MPPISPPAPDETALHIQCRARLFAAAAIAAALGLDIAIKRLMLAMNWNDRIVVPGFLETHYAHNRGVSFSLLWQSSSFGTAILSVLQMAMIAVLAVWAFRAVRPGLAAGLGLIIGGALGNIVDRLSSGAVFDFLVVRLGATPLFVCNSADLFISLGVLVIVADMLFEQASAHS